MLHPLADDHASLGDHVLTRETVIGHLVVEPLAHRPVTLMDLIRVGLRVAHLPERVFHERDFGHGRRFRSVQITVAAFSPLKLVQAITPLAGHVVPGIRAADQTLTQPVVLHTGVQMLATLDAPLRGRHHRPSASVNPVLNLVLNRLKVRPDLLAEVFAQQLHGGHHPDGLDHRVGVHPVGEGLETALHHHLHVDVVHHAQVFAPLLVVITRYQQVRLTQRGHVLLTGQTSL